MKNLARFYHKFTTKEADKTYWKNLHGAATSLAIACSAATNPLVVITPDILSTYQFEQELRFFLGENSQVPVMVFPDWETLPYDHFSPHEDIISSRLLALYQMPLIKTGIIIVATTTLMQRLPPRNFIEANSFILKNNDTLNVDQFRRRLENHGYVCVSKVMTHGEFAIRGSIIDIFPMGSSAPFRIDLLDTQVESIRFFDPETQRSTEKVVEIKLLPAKEYPLDEATILKFRQNWRSSFDGTPTNCPIFNSISEHASHPGIEYYLPLFFEEMTSFFDYLPENSVLIKTCDNTKIMQAFWQETNDRFNQLCHDKTHPLLPPQNVFIPVDQIFASHNKFKQILINTETASAAPQFDFKTADLPDICIESKNEIPLSKLQNLIKSRQNAHVLFVAESAGRCEILRELLTSINVEPTPVSSWQEFICAGPKYAIVISSTGKAAYIAEENCEILIITETQIFGEEPETRRSKKTSSQNPENIIRDLTELRVGNPVVHIDHGIGRYLGLQKIPINNYETEFLVLEYADSAKLYVPVASLNLISRYTGADIENVTLNQLGTKKWEKTKRAAKEKIRDVAAELLEIYARRASARGFSFEEPDKEYRRFAATFPFIETADQTRAINDVIADMKNARPMDRLVCGDVGFGKTEVAMRAAYIAVASGKQVAILTPTTLLAQQHFDNFQNRFASWPIRIALFSRFRTQPEQKNILAELANGKVDIVIGTHKLLQKNTLFKNLGLLIIDEEHRFGVKQKEHIKKLTPNIDILTLTATPIPRTLSMAFADIRNFSIIATPPAKRLAIKTFVHECSDYLLREAISREIMRGGQVYFLHNDITSIEKTANELRHLLPQAHIAVAHGQMPKMKLEQIMRDFYHLRINVLVCTTIIESGLDVPSANTIIIDRADKFGLAQLYQLRGRVGRSHHQAYAYLIVPPKEVLTEDAKKRLGAITSMEDLGTGFMLATHDLEIRGAGELLGEDQSGEIEHIGFSLYMEMLEQAVNTLKAGKEINLDAPLKSNIEIDLQIPALIPDKYVSDVNTRLVLYKRIADCKNKNQLDELQVEMIDRFGLLPEFTKNLFKIAELKIKAQKIDVIKITAGKNKGIIEFAPNPNIDPRKIIILVQKNSRIYRFLSNSQIEFTINDDSAKTKINFINNFLDEKFL